MSVAASCVNAPARKTFTDATTQGSILLALAPAAVAWTLREVRALGHLRVIFALGAVAYALYQHLHGLPAWERTGFDYLNAAQPTGLIGWLTVGTHGLEFRVHSVFYSYTEFFFTVTRIILWCAHFRRASGRAADRILRWTLAGAFGLLLALTLERTPMVMLLAGGWVASAVSAGRAALRRRLATVLLL